ncbi:MAG: hypothetical protein H6Q14_952 [Bacteroidetes bacterium]|nr:hypothetical protein [Bacteroidota bacterium]
MDIEKSQGRDFSFKEKFFEKFFRENYSRFYYYALHFISDSEICKDIVSEAFKHVWEKGDGIIPETLHAYMFNRIRNSCIDHIRHAQVEESYIKEHQKLVSEMDDESWMETEKRIQKIMDIIQGLPTMTRMIMEQNYLHQKKYKEIADMFEMSESGIRKHVMKGLEIIRKEFSVNYKKGSNQN